MLKVIFTIGIGLSLIFGLCILDTATSEYDNGTITGASMSENIITYTISSENNGNITISLSMGGFKANPNVGDSVQVKKNILGIWRIVGEPV